MHKYAPLRVNSNWAVSLSQLCAAHLNTGSPMLSNVSTLGHTQYFFKSCLAIATTGLCSVSLLRMYWPLVPQNRTNAMLRNSYDALVYIANRSFFFFQKRIFANHLMTALLLATDEVHTQSLLMKHFCLKNMFFCYSYHKDTKSLAMTNGAAIPPWIAVTPS